MTLTPDEIDHHLNAILRASGSALKNHTMHKTLADMRSAVSALLAAADAKRTSPQPAQAQAVPGGGRLGALAKRVIFDAIRGAYDLGYSDARNARAVPGDSAPGCDGRNVEADHGGALHSRLKQLTATPTPPATNSYAAVTVAAVAEVSKKDGEPALTWLIEGGVYEVPIGSVLLVADRPITDDSGHGEVYTTPPATEQAEGAPERIWLQINPEGDPSDTGYPDDHDGVSWCWHSIGGQEVEYVRADLAQPAHDAGVDAGVVKDAARYRALVACGAYTASVFRGGSCPWGLASGRTEGSSKAELDAAIDERGAARAKGATS